MVFEDISLPPHPPSRVQPPSLIASDYNRRRLVTLPPPLIGDKPPSLTRQPQGPLLLTTPLVLHSTFFRRARSTPAGGPLSLPPKQTDPRMGSDPAVSRGSQLNMCVQCACGAGTPPHPPTATPLPCLVHERAVAAAHHGSLPGSAPMPTPLPRAPNRPSPACIGEGGDGEGAPLEAREIEAGHQFR